MAKITVKVQLEMGLKHQVVIKVAGKTLHFEDSGSQVIDNVDPKNYIMLISGFQDAENVNSTINVQCKQGNTELSNTTITDRKFIRFIPISVQ